MNRVDIIKMFDEFRVLDRVNSYCYGLRLTYKPDSWCSLDAKYVSLQYDDFLAIHTKDGHSHIRYEDIASIDLKLDEEYIGDEDNTPYLYVNLINGSFAYLDF